MADFLFGKDMKKLLVMKDKDLEKEVKDYIYTLPHSRTGIPGGWKCSWSEEEVIEIVKHFYELGLKAQKGDEL